MHVHPVNIIHHSPLGPIGLHIIHDELHHLSFLKDENEHKDQLIAKINPFVKELSEYFVNPKHIFNLKIHLKGSDFQIKVWEALKKIPSGKTETYSSLAERLNSHPRAIGYACRTNPVPIIIPCHRVVAKKSLGGYNGETTGPWLTIKQWLLNHEGGKVILSK